MFANLKERYRNLRSEFDNIHRCQELYTNLIKMNKHIKEQEDIKKEENENEEECKDKLISILKYFREFDKTSSCDRYINLYSNRNYHLEKEQELIHDKIYREIYPVVYKDTGYKNMGYMGYKTCGNFLCNGLFVCGDKVFLCDKCAKKEEVYYTFEEPGYIRTFNPIFYRFYAFQKQDDLISLIYGLNFLSYYYWFIPVMV
jgi:hypothetical protein